MKCENGYLMASFGAILTGAALLTIPALAAVTIPVTLVGVYWLINGDF
jgi:uncharacterized membrane protein HdeD (DUF308 family)